MPDRSHESIINDSLARVMRERIGLNAVAETLRERARPDIIVRLEGRVVVIETELEPALTVEADALSRLGMEIGGLVVQNVFAVSVPGHIRSTDQQFLYERLSSTTLRWQEWRSDGTSGPKLSGNATELGQAVVSTYPPAGDLDAAVEVLDKGVRFAGSKLYQSPGTVERVSKIFGAEPGDETANMAALVITNAMVFQDRLASNDAYYQPVSAALRNGSFSSISLRQAWESILSVDYYPIFSMARDVVAELSEVEAAGVLEECARTASELLGMGSVGRHDVAGRIFNKLVSDRKLLAAYYTSIPASILLAGLALSPTRWTDVDWSDVEALADLRVVDPACGTGTLLMAAYRQIAQNYTSKPGDRDLSQLHKALVENVVMGADVVQAAIHMTAATLAAMSPFVRFEQMQLHTLRLGVGSEGNALLGSLDWLKAPEIQSSFSATQEQIGAVSGTGGLVPLPNVDLVISNPPYTRRGSDGSKEDAIARVFQLPEGDEESAKVIASHTSALLRGTPANQMAGHASSFTVLADRLVKRGGRVALVLPVTALSGESWRGIRKMLASRYEVEFVISSHDPDMRSMSYDTGIAETLIVARRLNERESPSGRGRFVNLWRAARSETDALALVSAVNSVASRPVLLSDGPPVGGSTLMVGGEQWGEMVEGPVGESVWKAARWKHSLIGQFATAVERGELWTEDGISLAGHIPIADMSKVCNVGPQHRRIRGSLGVFDGYHGYNEQAQFPALWQHRSAVHQGLIAEPNAWLVPRAGRNFAPIWEQSGTLHVTPDFQYDSQRVMTTRTNVRALGVRAWHTLTVNIGDTVSASRSEVALALWCNSTLGVLLHAHSSNRTQVARGMGNKGMLESLPTLDVRELAPWQLEAAQGIWQDFELRKFESFHKCAVDPVRIELDERIARDMLGLGEDAVAAVARLRVLLASDPSIHGSKRAELG
ncbi:MAG: hypothetical protein OXC95_05210 [Dehalococcoidia bacterium]|nr:hypothetical protein [Dehalococcoidia bacterium]